MFENVAPKALKSFRDLMWLFVFAFVFLYFCTREFLEIWCFLKVTKNIIRCEERNTELNHVSLQQNASFHYPMFAVIVDVNHTFWPFSTTLTIHFTLSPSHAALRRRWADVSGKPGQCQGQYHSNSTCIKSPETFFKTLSFLFTILKCALIFDLQGWILFPWTSGYVEAVCPSLVTQ